MDKGAITGVGRYQELIMTHGEYKRLYQEDILIQKLESMN